jgi:cystathionine beta-lyase family protein involved in aluminum resistance
MSQQVKFNENNVYRVRRSSKLNQGLFLSKLVIKKHGSVQIEGMGETISLVFKLSQILAKNGYATITSIQEENIEREGRREINPKISVLLKKTPEFDKLTEGLVLRENEK